MECMLEGTAKIYDWQDEKNTKKETGMIPKGKVKITLEFRDWLLRKELADFLRMSEPDQTPSHIYLAILKRRHQPVSTMPARFMIKLGKAELSRKARN